jgi:hypothetical protein
MPLLPTLVSGLVGATTLTLLHETARRIVPEAPRADVLGMRTLAIALRALDTPPPRDEVLHRWALLGDLIANSLYYSFVGIGAVRHAWRRGALLGLLAGVGAVVLPGPLGLGNEPTNRERSTQVMTVLWYLTGGLAAAVAAKRLRTETSR